MQEKPVILLFGVLKSHHASANNASYSTILLKNKENLNQRLFIPGIQIPPGKKVKITVELEEYINRALPLTPAVTLPTTSTEAV